LPSKSTSTELPPNSLLGLGRAELVEQLALGVGEKRVLELLASLPRELSLWRILREAVDLEVELGELVPDVPESTGLVCAAWRICARVGEDN
jgi:hypothetical protein